MYDKKLEIKVTNGITITLSLLNVKEKVTDEFVPIELGQSSNRLYTFYIALELIDPTTFNNPPRDNNMPEYYHPNLLSDRYYFHTENKKYLLIKISSFNKIRIDRALDVLSTFYKSHDQYRLIANKLTQITVKPINNDYLNIMNFLRQDYQVQH